MTCTEGQLCALKQKTSPQEGKLGPPLGKGKKKSQIKNRPHVLYMYACNSDTLLLSINVLDWTYITMSNVTMRYDLENAYIRDRASGRPLHVVRMDLSADEYMRCIDSFEMYLTL